MSALMQQLQAGVASLLQMVKNASPLDYASVGVGVFIAVLYFKIVFGGFYREPSDQSRWDLWPLIGHAGVWDWATLKLIIWVGLSVGTGFLAHHQLPRMFPQWFH